MSQHIYYDKNNVIRFVSSEPIRSNFLKHVEITGDVSTNLIGQNINTLSMFDVNSPKPLKLALICNWNDQCGISTYTKFLAEAIKPKISQLKVFSEIPKFTPSMADDIDISYCWRRGQKITSIIKEVAKWKPTVTLIQHEFGLFPRADRFLPFVEKLSQVAPLVTTLHSVYEHLDKSVCTSALKNVIVHSEAARNCLKNTLKHSHQNVHVIPHGCVDLGEIQPQWNYFGSAHPIIQFGFGFKYKGVDVALRAIKELKDRNQQFKDVFYCFLCSQNEHTKHIQQNYYKEITVLTKELGLEDHVTIQQGFYTEDELNAHLRTARLAIFPYQTDPNNIVYGASGAVRIAMANNIPTIASTSCMFSDMEGVLARPKDAHELSKEIERTFMDKEYRGTLLKRQREYIQQNTWEKTADRYLKVLKEII